MVDSRSHSKQSSASRRIKRKSETVNASESEIVRNRARELVLAKRRISHRELHVTLHLCTLDCVSVTVVPAQLPVERE